MITLNDVLIERKRLRHKKRNIFNDDGAAITYYDSTFGLPITEENWLGFVFGPHRGLGNNRVANPTNSDITTFVFNLAVSGSVHYNSKIPDMQVGSGEGEPIPQPDPRYVDLTKNIIRETGKDALQVVGDFFEDKDAELFYGVRVNDKHDGANDRSKLNTIKKKFWDNGGLLSNGINAGLDFAYAEARDLMRDTVLEVVNNDVYKISGVCLDFNRHLGMFKNVVNASLGETTQEQLDIVTDWLYEINDAINTKNIERMNNGLKPLLLMIKAPDDFDYARKAALDIERWLADGVVDIYVPIGYQQFRLLQETCANIKKHGVAVCPSILDVRLNNKRDRWLESGLRGRICQVLGTGANGVEFFNFNYGKDPHWRGPSGIMWRSLSYEKCVDWGDRHYFVTWTNQDPLIISTNSKLPGFNFHSSHFTHVSSDEPYLKSKGEFMIEIYENSDYISNADIEIYMDTLDSPPDVSFNGAILSTPDAMEGGFRVAFDKSSLLWGVNVVALNNINGAVTDIKIRIGG